jgi:hypothetical protein
VIRRKSYIGVPLELDILEGLEIGSEERKRTHREPWDENQKSAGFAAQTPSDRLLLANPPKATGSGAHPVPPRDVEGIITGVAQHKVLEAVRVQRTNRQKPRDATDGQATLSVECIVRPTQLCS